MIITGKCTFIHGIKVLMAKNYIDKLTRFEVSHTRKNQNKRDIKDVPFVLGVKRRRSNFLRHIKELIEELKKPDTVLLLEYYRLFKQTYITSENNINCHAELVSASYQ